MRSVRCVVGMFLFTGFLFRATGTNIGWPVEQITVDRFIFFAELCAINVRTELATVEAASLIVAKIVF